MDEPRNELAPPEIDPDEETDAPVEPLALIAALGPLSPVKRVDYLISQPNASAQVAALSPWSLFHLVKEVGESDCLELIHLATDEQTQAFVDLECWQKDHLNPARLERWIDLLLQQEDDENLRRQLRALDPEALVLMMMNHVRVFVVDEDDEESPELVDLQRQWETSPDGYYRLVYDDDEDAARLIRRFLAQLFAADIGYARTLLEAQRAEFVSSLEETAYTVRCGRMEEMGFVPWQDALGLYAPEAPESARRRVLAELDRAREAASRAWTADPVLLPALYRDQLSPRDYLAQVLAELHRRAEAGDDAFDFTAFEVRLIALTNKAMAAEPVEPGDLDASRRVFRRVVGYVSIGLQYAGELSMDRAVELLRHVHPHTLLRAGFALTLGLKVQAERMVAGGNLRETLTLTDQPLSLVPESMRVVLTALLRPRPEYGDPDAGYSDPFTDIGQIHKTGVRVSLTAFEVMALFGILGFDRATVAHLVYENTAWPPVELVDLHTLLRTVILHRALGHDSSLQPLTLSELTAAIAGPLAEARAALATIGPEPRSAAALAPLDDTRCGQAAFTALTTGDPLDGQALPVVRTVVRRLVESLVELLGEVRPDDLRHGVLEAEDLGNVALLSFGGARGVSV